MNLPTFSALPRVFRCRASTVLPRVNHSSEDARVGQARHKFLERIANLCQEGRPLEDAREKALSEAPEVYREMLSLIDLDTLRLEQVAAEVAIAFNVRTGTARELGRGLERDYGVLDPDEVVGTLDRVALISDRRLYVGDYKGPSHKRRPEGDEQILAGALAACRLFGRAEAEIEVIRFFDGDPFHSKTVVGPFELDSFEARLQALLDRIVSDRASYDLDRNVPPATTGEHCSYCPCIAYCPAKMALARAVIGGDSDEMQRLVKDGAALITTENAARLYELVHDGEKVLEIVKDALADFARVTPVELPNGMIYGVNPDSEKREFVDGAKVKTALQEIFGDAAEDAVTIKASWDGIERATRKMLGKAIKNGDLKHYTEEAEALLKERGLIRVSVGGVLKAYRPKKGAGGVVPQVTAALPPSAPAPAVAPPTPAKAVPIPRKVKAADDVGF